MHYTKHLKRMPIDSSDQNDQDRDLPKGFKESIKELSDPKYNRLSTENNPKKDLMPLPLVHSELDEYGFDPYEFRIYAHIVRRTGGKLDGKCFAKLKKTAEICKMSVRKTQYALKTLCDAGLILKEQRKGRSDIYRLASKSNWKPKEQLPDIRQKAKESKVDKLEDSEEDPTNINE